MVTSPTWVTSWPGYLWILGLGRMLIEASRRGVLDAVLVMVGGMSVMDVRERPQDKQEQADQAHKKFNDEQSDFSDPVAYLVCYFHVS